MARLTVRLLGQFQIQLDGKLVTGFKTDKARALLAYLAVEAGRPHQRTHLAGLLWPDWPEEAARTYLRQAFANLRQVLDDDHQPTPFLLATRQLIQLNPTAEIWLDVGELAQVLADVRRLDLQHTEPDMIARLQSAVTLYRGRLLEGFFLDGCSAFEEWQLLTGEQLQRQVVEMLNLLFRWQEAHGDLVQAQQYAQRCVEVEPLLDEPHRHLMRLLALTGEPNAALAHFEQYRRLLVDELDALPPPETVALAEQIRTHQLPVTPLRPAAETTVFPSFLALAPAPSPSPPFVAREQELTQLNGYLKAAITGVGSLLFVVGDAGQGKTALLRTFTRLAAQTYPDLLVVGGSCSSYGGAGDPLLPFRAILAQLTGDLEAPWTAGIIDREQARRLWSLFPVVIETLLLQGPDLVGTLVPLPALRARLALLPAHPAWLAQLEQLVQSSPTNPDAATPGRPLPTQRAIFDHFTRVLQVVARRHPLLLWLDDLHWADRDSIALLFHLSRHLDGCRMLVVGTYRPEELALDRKDRPPLLVEVVPELLRRFGHGPLDLNRAQGRAFIAAYLDTEPNRLGPHFREQLYRISGGHPLFTVELLRSMQESGHLIRDAAGYWVEGSALTWERVPVRVGAVISQRIDRLPDELRRLLLVASVQGEQFTAEIVAAVMGHNPTTIAERLSNDLERQHQLIVAEGVWRLGSRRLARYRFRHALFQKYLLDSLDLVERVWLHEAVAQTLETLARQQPDEVTVVATQLAWHYQQAELPEKALPYHILAGQWAIRLSANQEALGHFEQGLALLDKIADSHQRTQWALELLGGCSAVQAMIHGGGSAEVAQILDRAAQLGRQSRATPALFQVLWRRWEHSFQRGEFSTAHQQAVDCLRMAEQIQEPALLAQANIALGSTLYRLGQMAPAQQHLSAARMIMEADLPAKPHRPAGMDPAVNYPVNEAIVLWYLGYAEQAQRRIDQALARAEAQTNVFSLVFALVFAAGLYQRSNDAAMTLLYAERAAHLSAAHQFALWGAAANLYQGWALVARGEHQRGLELVQQSRQRTQQTGLHHIRYDAVLADAYARCGQGGTALTLVEHLLAVMVSTDEREWEAELHRLQGELLLLHDPGTIDAAESCFKRAIDVARRQQAKALELRAALSLCRLWQTQGQRSAAHALLTEVYDWFSEGFDTPDLQEARALLEALA